MKFKTHINQKKVIEFSNRPSSDVDTIWFDTTLDKPRIYNRMKEKWGVVDYVEGYTDFDNNLGGVWPKYLSIPIKSDIPFSTQLKITIESNRVVINTNYIDPNNININNMMSYYNINLYDFWNNVKRDGSDIRIFDELLEENYFWIENFDLVTRRCEIWVKVNAGQRQINIAYGNKECLNSEFNNGGNVFEFFDDFYSLNNWYYTGHVTVSNSEVSISPGRIQSKKSFNTDNLIVQFKAKVTSNTYYHTKHLSIILCTGNKTDGYGYSCFFRNDEKFQFYWKKQNVWTPIAVFDSWKLNTFTKIKYIIKDNSIVTFINDLLPENIQCRVDKIPNDVDLSNKVYLHSPRLWSEMDDGPFIIDYVFVSRTIDTPLSFDKPSFNHFH